MNKILTYTLMALGECFIIFTSFVFLASLEPTNLLTLNTIALSIAYLLTYALWFDLFNIVSLKDKDSTSQIGALIWGSTIYLLLSIGAIICSYIFKLELSLAIWAQCAAVLPLLFSVIFSLTSKTTVSNAMQQHDDRKLSLQQIADQLSSLEVSIKCNPKNSQRIPQIDNIKEQLRYITHSSNPKAKELEANILNTIIEMKHLADSTLQDSGEWSAAIDKCITLISLRKQQI